MPASETHGEGGAVEDPAFAPILAKYRAVDAPMDSQTIQDRLFLPMLVEASRALEEGIVREPSDVDMGLILGTGFPPFRGGILRWCDTEGSAKIVKKLEKYRSLGKRFEPTDTLTKMAKTGATFYPVPKLRG